MRRSRATPEQTVGTGTWVRTRVAPLSFGYTYGLPMDADLVVDMRFLPNPYRIPRPRVLTGQGQVGYG